MPSSLKDFYLNETMRTEVRAYLEDYLKLLAVERAFAKEDVSGIADAREIIEKAFENLEAEFRIMSGGKDIKNEAR